MIREISREKLLKVLGIELSVASWEEVFSGDNKRIGEWREGAGFADPNEAFQAEKNGFEPSQIKDRFFCPKPAVKYDPTSQTFPEIIQIEIKRELTAVFGEEWEQWKEWYGGKRNFDTPEKWVKGILSGMSTM